MDWRCNRWAIVNNKTGKEVETLGWYKRNTSRNEVLSHSKKIGFKIKRGQDIRIVEEY